MSDYRLAAFDVDGTLVGPGPDEVRPAVVAALRAAHAAGVRVAIATGRGPRMTLGILEQIGIPMGLVMANGALVQESGEAVPLEHRLVPPEIAREAIAAYRDAGYEPVVFDDPRRGEEAFYERDHPSLERWLARNGFRCRRVADLAAWLTHGVLMIGVFGDEERIRATAAELEDRFAGRASVQPIFHPKYDQWTLDVFAPECTKWRALRRYAAAHGLAEAAIMAVGDGLNDLPMLLGAGLGVAMGNADPEVLEAADARVGTFEEDGAAEAIERFLLARARSVA